MNKRLPVWEVAFDDGTHYYVETATASLAALSRPSNGAERFGFSHLHLPHYGEMWLGKETGNVVKNLVLISSTLGLLLPALSGTLVYLSKKAGEGIRGFFSLIKIRFCAKTHHKLTFQ